MKFDSTNFQSEVMEAGVPVMVDFYADWCGPCKMMAPLVEKMEQKYEGKMKIGKLNVEEAMDIAQKYGVMNIPTFIFFKDGEVTEKHIGGMSAGDLESKIEAHLK